MSDLLRRQVLIPEGLWQKVQRAAHTSKRSASAIVRQALQRYFEKEVSPPSPIPSFDLGAPDKIEREAYYDDRG